jgi:hypothetical protein
VVVEDLRDGMARDSVDTPTQQGADAAAAILCRAVVHGLIPANPAQAVAKPRQTPTRIPAPLAPETVEAIRSRLRTATR